MLTFNMKDSKESLTHALKALKEGQLVVAPTDTVYGLLADATNPAAVEKLFAFKSRPAGKAISVFVADLPMFFTVGEVVNPSLLSQFVPGPYTIIAKSKGSVDKRLEAEDGTIGIRIPRNDFIQALSRAYGKPITATSANISGKGPHYSADALLETLNEEKKNLLGLVLNAGELPKRQPSTLVNLATEAPQSNLRTGDTRFHTLGTVTTHSPPETWKKTRPFLMDYYRQTLSHAHILLLSGELGSGKTFLTRTLGEELGIPHIVSPTFVGMYEYDIKKGAGGIEKLEHYDFYSLQNESEAELYNLPLRAQNPKLFMVIEWPELGGAAIQKLKETFTTLHIHLTPITDTKREITVLIYIP